MPRDPELDVMTKMVEKIKELEDRVNLLESQEHASVRIVTADPATGYSGQIIINTTLNRIKGWAEGAWREMAAW